MVTLNSTATALNATATLPEKLSALSAGRVGGFLFCAVTHSDPAALMKP
jgi:hypothetical protein